LTFVVALAVFTGCGLNDYSNLVAQVQKTPAEEWHKWAEQVLKRAKTNSTPIPKSEFPAFVRRITERVPATNWQLAIQTADSNRQPYVCLYSLGGFQSIGVDFGSSSFTETNAPKATYRITLIYPGVYVRRSL